MGHGISVSQKEWNYEPRQACIMLEHFDVLRGAGTDWRSLQSEIRQLSMISLVQGQRAAGVRLRNSRADFQSDWRNDFRGERVDRF